VYICDECIDLCREIIEEEQSAAKAYSQRERIELPPIAEDEVVSPGVAAPWEFKTVRATESALGSALAAQGRQGWDLVGIAPRTLGARRTNFELEAVEYVLVLRRPVSDQS
jgi:hypothetical protein